MGKRYLKVVIYTVAIKQLFKKMSNTYEISRQNHDYRHPKNTCTHELNLKKVNKKSWILFVLFLKILLIII